MSTVKDVQVLPEEKQLQIEGPQIVQDAEAFKVTDDLTLEQAVTKGNEVKKKFDLAVAFFKPMKDAAHAAHKAICDREKMIIAPYEAAKKLYIGKAATYQQKKQDEFDTKEREAKEKAAQQERDKKAELDKEAKEKEAQAKILAAKAAELRKSAREAKKNGKTENAAKLLAAAEQKEAEAKALDEKVQLIQEEKENVYVAPKPVAQVSKPQGMSVQYVWAPEVIDAAKVPVKWYTEVDLGRLKRAKTADPTLNVPGIRFVQKAQGAALGGGK